jgi:hypothetical protein
MALTDEWSDPTWKTRAFSLLQKALGKSPCLWLHVGGWKSEQVNKDNFKEAIMTPWLNKVEYAGFRSEFPDCLPLPYSQNGGTSWDVLFQELASIIKSSHVTLSNATDWLNKLNNAQGEAENVLPAKVRNKARTDVGKTIGLQALLAVAIYCDGLSYAKAHAATIKADAMRKLIAKECPGIVQRANLNAFTDESAKAVAEKATLLIDATEQMNAKEGLDRAAAKFLEAYKTAQT